MTAPALVPAGRAADPMVFDAIAEAANTAATYADAIMAFAAVKDGRGARYALRCCAAALATANEAAAMLRPFDQREGA